MKKLLLSALKTGMTFGFRMMALVEGNEATEYWYQGGNIWKI